MNSNIAFLWQSASNSVSLMNIGNLDKQQIIDHFWDEAAQLPAKIEPITLVMNIKPEKLLGLAQVEGKSNILRTYDVEKKKMKTFEFEQCSKELGISEVSFKVVSIDKSLRTNLFFAAIQLREESCKVLQVKIGKDGLSAVAATTISVPGFTSINRITSYQIEKSDYILAAGTNSLVLLSSKDKNLSVIHVLTDLLAGELTDSCIFRNKFFAVSPGYQFIAEATASNKVDEKTIQDMQKLYNDDAKEEIFYERYVVNKLEIGSSMFSKLDINKKGDTLYAIGKGIVAITGLNSGKPTTTDVFLEIVKCLRNGNILLQDTKSNDLIELSGTLKEVKRIKGTQGVVLQNDSFRCSRHSHDESILPWMKGGNLVSLVTIKDMSMKEIKNFFGQESESEVVPLISLCNTEGDKAFGTSLIQGKMRLSYWDKSTAAKYYNLTDLFANYISLEGNVLFIGGSTSFDFKRGQAILQAVNFNKKLSYITDIIISESDNLYVSKIMRIEGTNKIMVCTARSIYVYLFKNQLFNYISVIQNLLPGGDCLADMTLFKNSLFVICSNTKTIHQIEFASS